MLRHIDSKKMGRAYHGWLDSHFHFSFAEYYHPDNVNFGVLRVVNDDIVQPNTGFDLHPHENMEILSYVVEGELSHADSMGNKQTLTRGQVQYMSAGTGIVHSEHNWGKNPLRFLQIWIFASRRGIKPNYGDYRFKMEDRQDKWLALATDVNNTNSEAPIKIHADINAYASLITQGRSLDFKVGKGRQAYLVLIEGQISVGEISLAQRDALEIVEQDINIDAKQTAHVLVIEMAKA